jgi:capsular polysaccharide biosynthesis protein
MIKPISLLNNEAYFYEGTYHKDYKKNPLGFHATELVPGLADSTDKIKVLNFLSENKKTYVVGQSSIYPLLSQIDTILKFYEDDKRKNDIEIIVDIVALKKTNKLNWISEILNNKQIKHTIVDSSGYRYLNINNFVEIRNQDYEDNGIFHDLYNNTISFVSNDPIKEPFRKVFISRKMTPNVWDLLERCDDHEKLETIFLENGFEICYPESQFNTFSEQVTYFNETKVLCGISGGGLTNSVFMQPKGKILEISTSFRFNNPLPGEETIEELHEYYLHIAWQRKHSITTISNVDRKVDEIEIQLKHFKIFDWLKNYD